MDSRDLAQQIARELSDGTAVIFLGVGASLGTESEQTQGNGVVGTRDLMRAIADRFGLALKDDSTLRGVASLAAKNRDPNTVKRFVIDQIRPGCGVPLAAYRALARIAPDTVMTTNYDDLYESALREEEMQFEKVVRSEQLVALPSNRPHVFKLHGDLDRPNEIVLTARDYREWHNGAGGLRTEVEATLQKKVCVFVGYSVRDENLLDTLAIIEGNYGGDARKHFAVVHEVDNERAAELEGVVEFVEGDATDFLEDLAEEVDRLRPQAQDPAQQRATFEDQLRSGDLVEAHETCNHLARYLVEHDRRAGAASLWRTFGEAAAAANEHRSAAMAFKEAGQLLFEVGYTLDAEPMFEAALNEAQVAGEPAIEQEVQPLLQRVRLSTGHFSEVLQDTEGVLQAYGDDAPPGLIYALHLLRAEANEMLHGGEEDLRELRAAIDKLPAGSLLRTKAWAQLARVQADAYDWDAARTTIDEASAEVQRRSEETDGEEGEVCHAVLKLVRANIYQATGEDESALRLYLKCTSVLQASGEIGLAVSALQGLVRTQIYVSLESSEADLRADLSDLLRDSSEHRQIADLERQGIAHLAQDNLAAAYQNLVQAMAAANRVHSYESHRRIQHWVAHVLLKSNHIHEALAAFAAAGTSKEAVETAKAARMSVPASTEGTAPPFDKLLAIASVGDVASRGAALAALAQLWDVLPDDNLPALVDYLSGLDSFRSSIFAGRSVLSDAADLVFNLAPRLDEGQAQNVGAAVIAAIQRRDVFWTAHKSACLALSRLANTHPEVLGDLDLPTTRLAEMASQDILNDTKMAMTALINLALAGSEEARRQAQSLLEDADTLTRVTWRHVLDDVTEEEVASTIRDLLPRTINRVQPVEGGFSLGISGLSSMFLRDWTLPESVKEEVANTLTQAVTDPDAPLPDRQSAASVLGLKAEQFREEERHQAVNALLDVLTRPFEAHDTVRSIDDPLSMLRMNMGQEQDVIAAAAGALLRFFELIDDQQQRQRVIDEVGKLRASQVEPIGRSIAAGLRHLATRYEDEERWLRTRLLLLLDSHHPSVRQDAARSLAALVERNIISSDSELKATVLFLAGSSIVEDREAAAYALSRLLSGSGSQTDRTLTDAIGKLRDDPSYLVRHHVSDIS